jgi:hypothetical protein
VTLMEFDGNQLRLELLGHQGQPATNPREILRKVLGFAEREALLVRIMKIKVKEMVSLS